MTVFIMDESADYLFDCLVGKKSENSEHTVIIIPRARRDTFTVVVCPTSNVLKTK